MATAAAHLRDLDGVIDASGWSMTAPETASTLVELTRSRIIPVVLNGKSEVLDDGGPLCPRHHARAHDPTYETTHHPGGKVSFHRRT